MRSTLALHLRTPLACALLSASLLITACGDDEPQAAAPAATTAATQASTTPADATPAASDADAADAASPDKNAGEPTTAPADAADESIAENTDASAPAGTVDSAPGVGDAKVPIVTTDQDPITITVAKGDLVAFRAVTGTDELVRIQGRNRTYPVSAGVSRIIRFTPKKAGKYAITFDEMGKLVGTLVVTD